MGGCLSYFRPNSDTNSFGCRYRVGVKPVKTQGKPLVLSVTGLVEANSQPPVEDRSLRWSTPSSFPVWLTSPQFPRVSSQDSVERKEEEEMFWIPDTLASHMGLGPAERTRRWTSYITSMQMDLLGMHKEPWRRLEDDKIVIEAVSESCLRELSPTTSATSSLVVWS